jgi:hypothetical protein
MLADAIGRALPELRAAAESLMQDTFTIYAPGEWETVDGIEEQVPRVLGTTPGKAQGLGGLRGTDPQTRTVTIGGVERPVINGGLHIPIDALVPERGWEYQLTELGPNTDPALLGRVWSVVEVPAKSYATARRLDVVEIPQEAP